MNIKFVLYVRLAEMLEPACPPELSSVLEECRRYIASSEESEMNVIYECCRDAITENAGIPEGREVKTTAQWLDENIAKDSRIRALFDNGYMPLMRSLLGKGDLADALLKSVKIMREHKIKAVSPEMEALLYGEIPPLPKDLTMESLCDWWGKEFMALSNSAQAL